MHFTTPEFVLFLPIVLLIFYATRRAARWWVVLAASMVFYAFVGVEALIVLAGVTVATYSAGLLIEGSARLLGLLLGMGVNIGVLLVLRDLLNPPGLSLVPLVGAAFYTLHGISYIVDVYRRVLPAERHFGLFAAYLTFFPKLIAGPIQRAGDLLPQLHQPQTWDEGRVVAGLRLILWGAFKKVAVADRLGIYVDTVYSQPQNYTGLVLIAATVFFAFQIYADFSGYIDIARGVAKLLGIELPVNFRQPYFARSVRDFWARWHITLVDWFRDYVYRPLVGGEQRWRVVIVVLVTFLLGGLWHGSDPRFILWGGLHGALFLLSIAVAPLSNRLRLPPVIPVLVNFVVISLLWVLFRAETLNEAGYIYTHLLVFTPNIDLTIPFASGLLGAMAEFVLSVGLIGLLLIADWFTARGGRVDALPGAVRWAGYYALGAGVVFSGLYAPAQPFLFGY